MLDDYSVKAGGHPDSNAQQVLDVAGRVEEPRDWSKSGTSELQRPSLLHNEAVNVVAASSQPMDKPHIDVATIGLQRWKGRCRDDGEPWVGGVIGAWVGR